MTPDELDQTLVKFGLTQAGASKLLGVTSHTVHRWVTGKVRIPPPIAILFRLMVRFRVSPELLDKLRREKNERAAKD